VGRHVCRCYEFVSVRARVWAHVESRSPPSSRWLRLRRALHDRATRRVPSAAPRSRKTSTASDERASVEVLNQASHAQGCSAATPAPTGRRASPLPSLRQPLSAQHRVIPLEPGTGRRRNGCRPKAARRVCPCRGAGTAFRSRDYSEGSDPPRRASSPFTGQGWRPATSRTTCGRWRTSMSPDLISCGHRRRRRGISACGRATGPQRKSLRAPR
jgi:hypothetical protein